MGKRSTIGNNPLDTINQENPLDTVVPDLAMATRAGRGQPVAEALLEAQERLQALEAGFTTLRADMAGLKGAAAEAVTLKSAVAGLPAEVSGLRREVEQLKAEAAGVKALQAEVTQLKDELTKLRASATPGDLPFWMRGRKK
jgi:prefoldin subunit 5